MSKFFYSLLWVFVFGLTAGTGSVQAQIKVPLTEADYHLWGKLRIHAISDKGNWVSYKMKYDSNEDTLFVSNTSNKKKYAFPKVNRGKFIAERKFVFLQNDSLVIFDINNAKKRIVTGVQRFAVSANGKFVVSVENATSMGKSLCIRNDKGKLLYALKNIDRYRWNNAKNQIVWTITGDTASVGIINLKKKITHTTITKNPDLEYTSARWQENSTGVVFVGVAPKSRQNKLLYYNQEKEKLYVLKAGAPNLKGKTIDPNPVIPLQASKDGSKVFFGVRSLNNVEKFPDSGVEIWYGSDKLLYPNRKLVASIGAEQFTAVWNPYTGTIKQLTTEDETWIKLSKNKEYALTANPLQYEPQYKLFADRDYYLTEISTGKKILFLKKQSGQSDMMRLSPNGKYISYYRKGNWWIYDIKKKNHINMTKGLEVEWDNSKTDPGNQLNAWGLAGWIPDEKSVLYYGYFDIWIISIDGKKRKKLTHGQETKTRFRFDKRDLNTRHNHSNGSKINLKKDRILTARNLYNGSSGYYILSPDKTVVPLLLNSLSENRLLKAKQTDAMVFETQSFDQPPVIMFKKNSKTKEKLVYQSNPHHYRYQWGFSEMIHYNSPIGKELNGALFYPADYKTTQKYPMIVWIYERVSGSINQYVNPTMKNTLGFNIANLTAKGYFVLLADIAFEEGNPGKSAVDCVTAAISKVRAMAPSKIERIGLIGHSFGGYETNFIITQTDIFSAAVSGSGVSDIMQHYFTVNSENYKVDAWRYENQQYRMGVSFFEDREAYCRNSPILHAKSISTPLLTWAGLLDKNVQSRQALTFYTALRRLKKTHIMLRYPDDGHILFKPKNQIDLTRRIQQWFDHFLKKETAPEWMKKWVE